MSRHHVNLIRSIFHDPPSGNLHWLNHAEGVLHRPHHGNTLDAGSLLHLREFLARAGITPSLYEGKGTGTG